MMKTGGLVHPAQQRAALCTIEKHLCEEAEKILCQGGLLSDAVFSTQIEQGHNT
jgi:hypothetical protein